MRFVRRLRVRAALVAAVALYGAAAASGLAPAPAGASTSTTTAKPRVFAYYYLWWSSAHWKSVLGSSYPFTASPLPLPSTLDATGCNPTALFTGATVTDVPAQLWTQDDPTKVLADVEAAAHAGLSGFLVNWVGTGSASQTTTSSIYTKRLTEVVDAVHQVNAEGHPFSLWLSYKASASLLTTTHIVNDLTFFARTYAGDPAFDRSNDGRVTVIWNGSRKYSLATIATVSKAVRSQLFLVGDDTSKTWGDGRASYLDGDSYYWSSQNPQKNPSSFTQIAALAAKVRASGTNPDGSAKKWFAPLIAGYDKQLVGGSCVPRDNGATLQADYLGNAQSNPDGWTFISWNEIVEGTYIDPSLQRWGPFYLNALSQLINGG